MDSNGSYSFSQDDLHFPVDSAFITDSDTLLNNTEQSQVRFNNLEQNQTDTAGGTFFASTSFDFPDSLAFDMSTNFDDCDRQFSTEFNEIGANSFAACPLSLPNTGIYGQQHQIDFNPVTGIPVSSAATAADFNEFFDSTLPRYTTSIQGTGGEDPTWSTHTSSFGIAHQAAHNQKVTLTPDPTFGGAQPAATAIGCWGPPSLTRAVTGSDVDFSIKTNQPGLPHFKNVIDIDTILHSWPGRCTWPGCDSQAFLKTRKLLETHVFNLHLNPLVCNELGCKRKKPFAKQGDYERHIASVHKQGTSFKCTYTTCPRHKKGFSRKDKLNDHLKVHDGREFCNFDHCVYNRSSRGTRYRLQTIIAPPVDHQNGHGPYECGIDECRGSLSSFSALDLAHHLVSYHIAATQSNYYIDVFHTIRPMIQELLPNGGIFTPEEGAPLLTRLNELRPGSSFKYKVGSTHRKCWHCEKMVENTAETTPAA